jgi:dTDP-4-amino-4,6-dideoxygalactose transaminase
MLSEIGSNFWINPNEELKDKPLGTPEQFGCKGTDYVWLSTGRSAISYAIKTIKERNPHLRKSAILPPFTCHTVIEPFLNAGYEVHHYPLNSKLEVSSADILKCAMEYDASIVLYHKYFGFETLHDIDELCATLRKRNGFTIEDCTQCLYSSQKKSDADFFVGSIRKWHGTPDGGFAVCREGRFTGKPQASDLPLEQAKVKASLAKYKFLFDHEGEKPAFLKQYREAEDILIDQKGFYTLSETSKNLQSNLDVSLLKSKRRQNFKTLLKGLSSDHPIKPLFVHLDEDTVPLYFPMLVEDRASLQSHLVQESIYAPVVWPKADCLGAVCEEVDYMYQHLLCIPIDQRYGEDDMLRVIETINNYYKK